MLQKALKHKLKLSLLVLLVITVIFVLFISAKLTGPVSVVAKQTVKAAPSEHQYDISLSPVRIGSMYASFNYPKGMTLKSTTQNSAPSVADYIFFAPDVYDWTLAIDIDSVPGGNVNQTSSFTYRLENPQKYLESQTIINGRKVYIFTDEQFSNGFSKVAFLSNTNLVATISLTGDDSSGTGPLQQAFNLVTTSWRWL